VGGFFYDFDSAALVMKELGDVSPITDRASSSALWMCLR
jgi:hypothetical protein